MSYNHVENGSGLTIRSIDGVSTPFLEDMMGSNCIDTYEYKFDRVIQDNYHCQEH